MPENGRNLQDPLCSQMLEYNNLDTNYQNPNIRNHQIPIDNELPETRSSSFSSQRKQAKFLAQKCILFEMLQSTFGSKLSINTFDKTKEPPPSSTTSAQSAFKELNRRRSYDNLSTTLSAFYAKFVVVLGIAFPVTDILSVKAPPSFYQGFYLYLYLVSVIFVIFIFISHLRTRTIFTKFLQHQTTNEPNNPYSSVQKPTIRYGSFYLKIGAIAFGIGSMVYSGLEFGQYFELKNDPLCQNVLLILNPAARMLLTIVQMQFLFINTKDLGLNNHKAIARFGLMHMLATNLCEWLYVLVEETKHEIIHIDHEEHDYIIGGNMTNLTIAHHLSKRATALEIVVECRRANIMGSLVQNASPFLFPCTIEYSLICAVTLFEMWKNTRGLSFEIKNIRKTSISSKGTHQFSVDCARAHRGMFGGILVTVLTIISLIVYFELASQPLYRQSGIFGITLSESLLFMITLIAVFMAIYQMRDLRYSKGSNTRNSLDCNLLVVAQSGLYIYSMFSIVGSYFSLDTDSDGIYGLINEALSLIQTSCQTMFILNTWWKRCRSSQEIRRKPGREIITFLLVSNMALWSINTLIKSRAVFRPTHLQFFGQWAWTVITHISMPLAIFYRLHSTICLFEIWKTTYKKRT